MITRFKMSTDYRSLVSATPRYPNDFKKKVILYAEKYNNSEAERVFGIAESNIRRWRKLKPLLFAKTYVSEKKKRLVKRASQNKDDFVYEFETVNFKKPTTTKGDYGRLIVKPDSSPKLRTTTTTTTSPPRSSPNIATSSPNTSAKDMEADEVCLRWNSHHTNMKTSFPTLLKREQYVDVTLTTEGKSLKCHRLILSSCSSYFDELLSGISPLQHPVIFLNGVSFWVLKALIDFMYSGEVHIEQNRLESLLKVAEMLQIKGLTGKTSQEEEKESPRTLPVKVEKDEEIVIKKEDKGPPQLKREEKIIIPKKESKAPIKKPLSPTLISPIDPLSLLQPTFFEENPIPLRFKEHVVNKKVIPKKIKKRKFSEQEPSPPPILYRKGTKSRPHVKVPRYYHNDYEDLDGKKLLRKEEKLLSLSAPNITYLDKIKSESYDIEHVDLIEVQETTDLNKSETKETPEKKIETQLEEKKIETESPEKEVESKNDNSEDVIELLEKEIKQEKIDDDDYIDLNEHHDSTI